MAETSGALRQAEARVGTVLRDKWRLDRVLGIGGFGVVYAATHRTGKRVAIKLLHPVLSIDPEIRKRFLREAYAANGVGHPGVVSVLDDDETEEGAAFLVMDLLDGETLEACRLRNGGRLPPADVLSVVDQVLDVLGAAHDKGIIHRDIKPENVFLTHDGSVKLLDFGLARIHTPGEGTGTTQHGAAMGTPAYMPPEQARGRWDLVDARSDLWALGATMFELLCGQPVHGDLSATEALVASTTRPAPSLATVMPDLDKEIVDVVDKSLEFEPERRWPDARAMQQAVRVAYHAMESGSQAPADFTPPSTKPAARPSQRPTQPARIVALPRLRDPGAQRSVGFSTTLPVHDSSPEPIRAAPPSAPRRGVWLVASVICIGAMALGATLLGHRPSMLEPVESVSAPPEPAAPVPTSPSPPEPLTPAARTTLGATAEPSVDSPPASASASHTTAPRRRRPEASPRAQDPLSRRK